MKQLLTVLVLIAVAGFVSSCGIKHSGKINVSGTVEHRLSLEELEEYFRAFCEGGDADKGGIPNANSAKPSPSPEEPEPEPSETVGDVIDREERIEKCVADKIAEFLEAVN